MMTESNNGYRKIVTLGHSMDAVDKRGPVEICLGFATCYDTTDVGGAESEPCGLLNIYKGQRHEEMDIEITLTPSDMLSLAEMLALSADKLSQMEQA